MPMRTNTSEPGHCYNPAHNGNSDRTIKGLTCSQLIDTRHCEQDLWRLKYERLLIALSGL